MYKRFKASLTKPSMVFLYIKDSFWKVFSYLLIMTALLTIPAIVVSISKPEMLFPSYNEINNGINKEFVNANLKIENGKLINENATSKNFVIDDFTFVVGTIPRTNTPYIILFEESRVTLYMSASTMAIEISSFKYENSELNNIVFSTDEANIVTKETIKLFDSSLIVVYVSQIFIGYLLDYLLIALVLTALSMMMRRLPLSFGNIFKTNIYLLTGWVIFNLIITLFGFNDLYYFTIIVAYVYQMIAYRMIRVVKTNGSKKENDDE
ncbi:DUF1189 family protein [Haploplasma axanthum]|uniref:DUF1189 domain-containing protein n=1 Tax=Haploplasma axanthum TaxID=29552 RepID=A0A449BCV0_HAPAX|nr:DUF1189 family protein [Haploplasma axanthum]VEU80274.1 Uncharacterised protein [Haploplasma axanthum]